METKGVTCKIPLELHNQISEEIRASGSTMGKFIEMVITNYYEQKEKGETAMGKARTMAFQVSEELFQRIKAYLDEYERVYHRKLTQKEFVIGLIEQALEEAEEEFEAARAAQEERYNSLANHSSEPQDENESDPDEVDGADEDDTEDAGEDGLNNGEGASEDETDPDETEDADDGGQNDTAEIGEDEPDTDEAEEPDAGEITSAD